MTGAVERAAERVDVAIVGSGFSGLGMAIRLKQDGRDDFVVFERGDDVGGTWHYNTYPGCACDVPSHLYSFSFAPNPDWSQTYSRQPEIRAYLHRCADDFGVRPHVRLRTEVRSAEWQEDEGRWRIETSEGDYSARVLVSAMGPLTEPKLPDVPGIETFEGRTFHSARWDHDYDLRGKRVASIGTGASAIQYVPAIQPKVEQLHVFQRTAPWIVPHTNRPITGIERRVFRALPALQRLVRGGVYTAREALVLGFVKRPRAMRLLQRVARRHMETQVSDPELLEKVTPDYTIGCKRILPSNAWYPALGQPNVELVPEPIAEVRASSVVTADGVERPVDAIVYGTGFQVSEMPAAKVVRGRGGKVLHDVWQGSPRAHLGSTVPGFPNLFLLLGPNTGLGHGSMVYMIESQVAHVLAALRAMDGHGADSVEVRPETARSYNDEIDSRMGGTVWSTGCRSWYVDATGRNFSLWPDWTFRFRQRAARFDPAGHVLRAHRPAAGEPVAVESGRTAVVA
ncbi:MAG TPA: NAD(P)/FAD-dependent oxidoreductase [Thermoleophilaceae bacterium]|jgi:cation diffusion facilitator CzcD-associated flavoprotein CzcO